MYAVIKSVHKSSPSLHLANRWESRATKASLFMMISTYNKMVAGNVQPGKISCLAGDSLYLFAFLTHGYTFWDWGRLILQQPSSSLDPTIESTSFCWSSDVRPLLSPSIRERKRFADLCDSLYPSNFNYCNEILEPWYLIKRELTYLSVLEAKSPNSRSSALLSVLLAASHHDRSTCKKDRDHATRQARKRLLFYNIFLKTNRAGIQ